MGGLCEPIPNTTSRYEGARQSLVTALWGCRHRTLRTENSTSRSVQAFQPPGRRLVQVAGTPNLVQQVVKGLSHPRRRATEHLNDSGLRGLSIGDAVQQGAHCPQQRVKRVDQLLRVRPLIGGANDLQRCMRRVSGSREVQDVRACCHDGKVVAGAARRGTALRRLPAAQLPPSQERCREQRGDERAQQGGTYRVEDARPIPGAAGLARNLAA